MSGLPSSQFERSNEGGNQEAQNRFNAHKVDYTICDAAGDREHCGIAALSGSKYCALHLKRDHALATEWSKNYFQSRLSVPRIDFSHQWLEALSFQGLNLSDSTFVGSQLADSSFEDSDLQGASFGRANLTGTVWHGANLTETKFPNAILVRANLESPLRFKKCIVTDCDAKAITVSNAIVTDVDFSKSDLNAASFRKTYFTRTNMSRVSAVGAKIHLSGFRESNLDGADFENAEFHCVDFSRSHSFAKASFRNARFFSPVFSSARFEAIKRQLEKQDATVIDPIIIDDESGAIPDSEADAVVAINALATIGQPGSDSEKFARANEAIDRELTRLRNSTFADRSGSLRMLRRLDWWLGSASDKNTVGSMLGLVAGSVAAAQWPIQIAACLPFLGLVLGGIIPCARDLLSPRDDFPKLTVD